MRRKRLPWRRCQRCHGLDRRRRHATRVAAGNSNANACNYTPARTPNAITLGATTNDRRTLVVLELRHVPRPVRARREHHVGVDRLVTRATNDDQRHVDGVAARRRRRSAPPPGEPVADAAAGPHRRSSTTRRRVSSGTPEQARRTACSSSTVAAHRLRHRLRHLRHRATGYVAQPPKSSAGPGHRRRSPSRTAWVRSRSPSFSPTSGSGADTWVTINGTGFNRRRRQCAFNGTRLDALCSRFSATQDPRARDVPDRRRRRARSR